jgi:hypothetical protein
MVITTQEQTSVVTPSKFSRAGPPRPVVGSDYYYAAGVVRSLTQLKRLKASGRVSQFFRVGSRLAQWKDVADADIARLCGQRPARQRAV